MYDQKTNSMSFSMLGTNVLYIDFRKRNNRKFFVVWVAYNMLYDSLCKFLNRAGYGYLHSPAKNNETSHGWGYVAEVIPEPDDEDAEPDIISLCKDVVKDAECMINELIYLEGIMAENGIKLDHGDTTEKYDYTDSMRIVCTLEISDTYLDGYISDPLLDFDKRDFSSLCQQDFQSALDGILKQLENARVYESRNPDYLVELDFQRAKICMCKKAIKAFYEGGSDQC